MFDHKPPTPNIAKKQPPVALPVMAESQPVKSDIMPVEDIFSKTDESRSNISRPTVPGQANQIPISDEDLFGRRSTFLSKLAKVAAVLMMLVVLALIGWAAYKYVPKIFSGLKAKPNINSSNSVSNNANLNLNVNATINGNNNANSNATSSANLNVNASVETIPPIDADSDGLSDTEENTLGTDPQRADSDNDGLIDYAEVKIYQTNPLNPDTDGDGHQDGNEVINGYNPNGPGKILNLP